MLKRYVYKVGLSFMFSFFSASLVLAVMYNYLILSLVALVAFVAVERKIGMLAPQIAVLVSGIPSLIPVSLFGDWSDLLMLTITLIPVGYALAEPFMPAEYAEGGWD